MKACETGCEIKVTHVANMVGLIWQKILFLCFLQDCNTSLACDRVSKIKFISHSLFLYFHLAHSCIGPIVLLYMSWKFLLYFPSFCSFIKDSFVLSRYKLYTNFLSFPLTIFFYLFNICNCVAHHSTGQYLACEWHRQNICYYS